MTDYWMEDRIPVLPWWKTGSCRFVAGVLLGVVAGFLVGWTVTTSRAVETPVSGAPPLSLQDLPMLEMGKSDQTATLTTRAVPFTLPTPTISTTQTDEPQSRSGGVAPTAFEF